MKNRIQKTVSLLLAVCSILALLCACTKAAENTAPETAEQPVVTAEPVPTEAAAEPDPTEVIIETAPVETELPTTEPIAEPKETVLVVYFSHTGTTREVAAYLHELVGGDLVELIPVEPYPEGYSAALDPAKQEQRQNARPAIKDSMEGIEQYDVIYLGYPIWWGTVPMIVYTFLESYDFTGKTVVPFATSGGTGIGQSLKDIRKTIPDAYVRDGLLVKNNDSILPWLQKLGLHE